MSRDTIAPGPGGATGAGEHVEADAKIVAPELTDAPRYFRVVGLEERQHYKTRAGEPRPLHGLAWLKLAVSRLDDLAFGLLPDQTKAHLILIELLAARAGNLLPFSEKFIRARINATSRVNLPLLLSQGFIALTSRPSLDDAGATSSPAERSEAKQSVEIAERSAPAAPGAPAAAAVSTSDRGAAGRIFATWAMLFQPDHPATMTATARQAIDRALAELPEGEILDGLRGGLAHPKDWRGRDGRVHSDLPSLLRFSDRIQRWAVEHRNAEADRAALATKGTGTGSPPTTDEQRARLRGLVDKLRPVVEAVGE